MLTDHDISQIAKAVARKCARHQALTPSDIEAIATAVTSKVLDAMKSDDGAPRELVTIHELASRLGLSTTTIERMVAAGALPRIKVGTRRLFHVSDCIAALKQGSASRLPRRQSPERTLA